MPILDTKITLYSNRRDTVGREGTFADYLRLCIAHKTAIERARREGTTRALKETLPCATLSGVFAPSRAAANLRAHSGLICIDIDHVEPGGVLALLAQIDCIAFASRSVSGAGVYAVVKVKHPDKHAKHYAALCRDLSAMGIEADKQCKDVCRLRFVSYDPEAILRPDAVEYAGLYEPPRTQPQRPPRPLDADITAQRVARCCDIIARQHIDITNDYDNWLSIGFALASLGESGRTWFHVVSAQSPKYDPEATDRKFNNLLNSVSRITIATFFKHCRDSGIIYDFHDDQNL